MRISDWSSDVCSSDLAALVGSGDMRAESDRLALQPVADDLVQPGERAAADEQDVGGVDLQELLLGMLAPALRRHGGGGALHDLEERLLDALARDVAGDGGKIGRAHV